MIVFILQCSIFCLSSFSHSLSPFHSSLSLCVSLSLSLSLSLTLSHSLSVCIYSRISMYLPIYEFLFICSSVFFLSLPISLSLLFLYLIFQLQAFIALAPHINIIALRGVVLAPLSMVRSFPFCRTVAAFR